MSIASHLRAYALAQQTGLPAYYAGAQDARVAVDEAVFWNMAHTLDAILLELQARVPALRGQEQAVARALVHAPGPSMACENALVHAVAEVVNLPEAPPAPPGQSVRLAY